ncbi:hypothetical protein J2W25_001999 [Variovorax boronicumulans]|uniref:DUF4231 domain-containing protein n=1 Tax=Variovorax boronicumulans TaxID=436515 RepID=A0AAW8DTU2_9BURK|nr:hypothetical protein [Variovorax boronicumulans]MDP9877694.1 hypothetical protein [Variovorax boronicumulans]MDP9922978.1 hypothetical protein [Variovorax boronicumulans]
MFEIIQGGKSHSEVGAPPLPDWHAKLRQLQRIDWRRRQRMFSSVGPRTSKAALVSVAAFLGVLAVSRSLEWLGWVPVATAFDMRLSGLISVAGGAIAYVLVQLWSVAPKTWSALLDVDLAAYEPVDRQAYRNLQERTRTSGYFEHAAIAAWLRDERDAVEMAAGWRKPRNSAFLNKKV